MSKVSREVHRKGIVKINYSKLQAMRQALAALEGSGWDIRYKVDDVTQVKEIYLEHPKFDVSDEYVEYRLEADGRLCRAGYQTLSETSEHSYIKREIARYDGVSSDQ